MKDRPPSVWKTPPPAAPCRDNGGACGRKSSRAPQPEHELLPALPLTEEDGLLQLDGTALFAAVLARRDRLPVEDLAARFHWQLAQGFTALAARAAGATGVRVVGLSGGVMQNALLARLLPLLLAAHGLTPLCQQEAPPGDGGISLWAGSLGTGLFAGRLPTELV